MSAEGDLYTLLAGVGGIVTIITGAKGLRLGLKGGLPADGVLMPAVTYERVSTVPSDDLTSGGALDQVRMQIDSWGETAAQAIDLADMVRDAIAPAATTGTGTLADRDGPRLDIETRAWGVRQDFIIWEERT